MGFSKAGATVYSIALNWGVETLLVRKSLTGYSILPQFKTRLPSLRTIDLIHPVDQDWNVMAATRDVAPSRDIRVAISETMRVFRYGLRTMFLRGARERGRIKS